MRTVVLICLMLVSLLANPIAAYSSQSDQSAHTATAELTEAHGTVYKRAFKDWAKQIWDDPVPAATGDKLSEGMQVGTGKKSWAEMSWEYVTTRIWADSVYAISPNKRLVYLTGGEMLYHLDKHRKDKNPYYVWTNLLQARVRGTTILFQATDTMSSISVLEGCVEVTNRLDHSTVSLKPGFCYEIHLKQGTHEQDNTSNATPTLSIPTPIASLDNTDNDQTVSDTPLAALPGTDGTNAGLQNDLGGATKVIHGGLSLNTPGNGLSGSLNNITATSAQAITVFETSKTISTLTAIDPQLILSNPLVQGIFALPLSSLPLVEKSLSSLLHELPKLLSLNNSSAGVGKVLSSVFSVLNVPTSTSYKVGNLFVASLPAVGLQFFPPSEVLGVPQTTASMLSGQRSGAAWLATDEKTMLMHGTNNLIPASGIGGATGGFAGATAGFITNTTSSVTSSVGTTFVPTIAPVFTPTTSYAGTAGVSTLLPGLGSTAAAATVRQVVPVTSIVPQTINTVQQTVNTLGGTLGKTVGSLTSGLPLSPITNPVINLLRGL